MPTLHVNDAEFYYELEGEGHPLICIAGYGCDHTQWLPLFPSFAKKFRTLIFDHRGSGRTKDQGGPLSADLLAEDVMQLAKALQLKDPHILGQSMGGSIAQIVAARFGGQMGKLGLLTTSAKWRKAMLLALESDILLREKGCSPSDILAMNIPWNFGEEFLSHPKNIQDVSQSILGNPYPQSLQDQKRQYEILKNFDSRHLLPKISSPTLIIYGKEDLLTLPHESEYLFTQIPNSQLIDMESGHAMIFEQPDELLKNLIQFYV